MTIFTTRRRWFYRIIGCTFAPLLIGAAPLAAQSGCQMVLDAMTKVIKTPAHLYVMVTTNGKPQEGESIYTAGAIYVKINGKWTVSPITPAEMTQQMQKNIQNSQSTCAYLKDELVTGDMAALFKVHTVTPRSTSDTQTWISKANGLPLRSVTDIDGGKIHTSTRFEYHDVKSPM
jgi:hypothetical protein